MNSGLYSHPDVLMEDHINGVLRIAKALFPNLPEWFYIPLAFHDFGKATSYFQDYIRSKRRSEYTDHSQISSIFCSYLAYAVGYKDNRILECFIFPLKHHTDMSGMEESFENLSSKKSILKRQLREIDLEKFNTFVEALDIPDKIKEKARLNEEVIEKLETLIDKVEKLAAWIDLERKKRDFFEFNFYFSLLLDADKTQAGSKQDTLPLGEMPDLKRLEGYKKTLDDSPLSEKRERAYQEVMDGKISSPILSINLPTGMGKTITGMSLALKIARENNMNRIIYCLPFLSIIDQAEHVLKSALGLRDSTQLIVHHHLSDIKYEEKDREYDFDVSRVFTEGWNSRIVLTTFYQFFYTLLAFENSSLRRFNKLYRSVVLIDEIQALPHRYWKFVKYMIERLVEKLECKVIFMTATDPFGYTPIVRADKYREGLRRYRLVLDVEERKTLEELAQEAVERISSSQESFLFVLNTISSSQEFYRLLKERLDHIPMTYLSTAVIPAERMRRIEGIKTGKYRVVVSTQVIEAGVDIDLDIVYRDFAPLDSIVQSAGRCNRNYQKDSGTVFVVRLMDQKGKDYCRRIYDRVLLDATEKFFGNLGRKELYEYELLNLVEEYYKELKDTRISQDQSKALIEYVEKLDYKNLQSFKLIEEQPYKDQVFVQLNQTSVEVLDTLREYYRKLRSREIDLWEFKRLFYEIRSDFYKYVINVNTTKNRPPLDRDLGIYLIERDVLDQYYDVEIGYKLKEEDLLW